MSVGVFVSVKCLEWLMGPAGLVSDLRAVPCVPYERSPRYVAGVRVVPVTQPASVLRAGRIDPIGGAITCDWILPPTPALRAKRVVILVLPVRTETENPVSPPTLIMRNRSIPTDTKGMRLVPMRVNVTLNPNLRNVWILGVV